MKWEYLTSAIPKNARNTIEEVDDKFEYYGKQGWELVSVDNGIAYFKRPIVNVSKMRIKETGPLSVQKLLVSAIGTALKEEDYSIDKSP